MHVIGGEMISILRRSERLKTKVKKLKAKQPLPALHVSGSRWTNCFVCNKNVHMLNIQHHVESHFNTTTPTDTTSTEYGIQNIKKGGDNKNAKSKKRKLSEVNTVVSPSSLMSINNDVHSDNRVDVVLDTNYQPVATTKVDSNSANIDVIDIDIMDDSGGGSRMNAGDDAWFTIPKLATSLSELILTSIAIMGRPTNCVMGQKSRFIGYDNTDVTVEGLVLQYYKYSAGWTGLHCEGGPFYALYALLMWEVLFMDIPEVFQTKYQDGPLDMDSPNQLFITNRHDILKDVLYQIRIADDTVLQAMVTSSWIANYGKCCRGMNWSQYNMKTLVTIACALGGRSLSRLFLLFSSYRKYLGGGMPDLLLWKLMHAPDAPCQCLHKHPAANNDYLNKASNWFEADSNTASETMIHGVMNRIDVSSHIEVEEHIIKSTSTLYNTGVDVDVPDNWVSCPLFDIARLNIVNENENGELLPLPFEYKLIAKFSEVKGPRDKLSDRYIYYIV